MAYRLFPLVYITPLNGFGSDKAVITIINSRIYVTRRQIYLLTPSIAE